MKGKYLKTSDSKRGRVIPRKLRDGVLRTILRRIKGQRFLDLSGGCGMMAIEAISRGAVVATMVERSARLRSLIAKNMEACEVKEGHGEVLDLEAVPFLQRMARKKRRWDLVFVDGRIENDVIEIVRSLGRSKLVEEGGSLVVCHPESMELPETSGSLTRWRLYTQDEDSVSYYEKPPR